MLQDRQTCHDTLCISTCVIYYYSRLKITWHHEDWGDARVLVMS